MDFYGIWTVVQKIVSDMNPKLSWNIAVGFLEQPDLQAHYGPVQFS